MKSSVSMQTTVIVVVMCGNYVAIGDRVAFNVRRNKVSNLHTGIVKGFSDKMVRVEYIDKYTKRTITSSYMPHNLVKVYKDGTDTTV